MKKLVFIILLVFPKISFSQTFTIDFYPEKDNSMFSENNNFSDGAGLYLFAGKTGSNASFQLRRGLVKFNTSSIPTTAQITNSSLQMAMMRAPMNSAIPFNFTIHKVLQNWGEGTSISLGNGAQAQGTDATWLYSLYNSSTQWTNLGGNFVATASANATVSFSEFPVNFGVWSSTAVNNDVSSWVANPSTNFGWIIIGNETTAFSARGFGSREQIMAYRPKLTITYSLPVVDKILINEVNPSKKWVEFYNPSANAVNLANYWLVNGAFSENIGSMNVNVLNGNLLLEAGKYVVVSWSNIGQNTGEIALFNKIPSDNTTIMKDYVQYGAGNQSKAAAAVTTQVWDGANAFLPTINVTTNSYSLNPAVNYASGQNTNSSSFLTQKETPSNKNEVCPATLTLSGNIIDATYQSSGQLKLKGNISSISNIKLNSQTSILLENLSILNSGVVFEAKVGVCQY